MASEHAFTLKPLSGALGAEVFGVDIAKPVSESLFRQIQQAFADYGVIFFRDQTLTPEQHIAFAERWGPININRFFPHIADYPQIAEVKKTPEQTRNIGSVWHTDHSYDEVPAMGSVLYALEVPSAGGDTLFANMSLAFETLSSGMQALLTSLSAWHSSRHVFGSRISSSRNLAY